MFKSIEYKLITHICLLIISVALSTYLALSQNYILLAFTILLMFAAISGLIRNYNKFNKNLIFLLNAVDNGDYAFNFSETKLSKREKELNNLLNKIKDILVRAREGVIENERFLSIIIESMPVGIIIVDGNRNIKSVNRATLQLLNLHTLTHIKQLAFINKDFPEIFRKLSTKHTSQIKVTNEREETEISLHLSKIKLRDKTMEVITLNSIGNELEAREMESWTQLIRVMTHEIMNSIAPITSLTETLLDSNNSDLDENTKDALQIINGTAKGLTSFVNSYRKFSGVPKPEKTTFKLKPLLDNVISLSKLHIQNNEIEIKLKLTNNNVELNADKDQIMQVLINLLKNGIEAIKEKENGIVLIDVVSGLNKISINISNNGEPISKEVAPNIFVPFFTTKETGTGIGLSLSRYIMRLHGGNLKYHTKDYWTIFSMIF